jgi:UDP-N-acetylmuramyl pentapeptide phosphotransferase/UDP-N-acetylglucosamine-1-phosphate transferase
MFNADYKNLIISYFPYFLIAIGLFSFAVNYFLTERILFIGTKRRLFSRTTSRDSHSQPTVALGGISIFIVALFTLLLVIGAGLNNSAGFFLASCFLLLMTGIKDDLIGSSARSKFIVQLIAALLFLVNPEFALGNLGGFLGFDLINPNYMTYGLGLLFILLITNAFNFIDGVDGLCASIAIICFSVFAAYFFTQNEFFYCIFCVVLVGSLSSFLLFNFRSGIKKIFLGDTGALLLGFLIAIFALRIVELQPLKPFVEYYPKNAVLFIFIVLVVPITDAILVISSRILAGQKPWTADRRHLHHHLLAKGYTHKKIVVILSGYQLLAIIVFVLLNNYNSLILHLFILIVFLNLLLLVYVISKPSLRK